MSLPVRGAVPQAHTCIFAAKCGVRIFAALTHGFAPDGSKLVQNAGKFDGEKKRNRHRGISIVLNAQKSLSMVWAFAEPAFRERIEAAFERAAKCTIHEFIEPEIARCRTGDGTEVAAKLAAAMFIHASSREQDAHYHAHVVLPNIGLCSDGRTRAWCPNASMIGSSRPAHFFAFAWNMNASSLACNSTGR